MGASGGEESVLVEAPDVCVLMTTVASHDAAMGLARELVEGRYAACVQVLPQMTSVYRWQGAVHAEAEWLLLVKTRHSLREAVARRVIELHGYETPEVVVLEASAASRGYVAWLGGETVVSKGR